MAGPFGLEEVQAVVAFHLDQIPNTDDPTAHFRGGAQFGRNEGFHTAAFVGVASGVNEKFSFTPLATPTNAAVWKPSFLPNCAPPRKCAVGSSVLGIWSR